MLRVVVAAHGNPGGFVVAGSRYVSVTRYTRFLPIRPGTGYDGQFYYRLSLDPLEWSRRAFGVQLDNTGRLERVAYPAIVWVLSADDPSAVPVVMIIVNVAALGVLAALCAALARDARRHPLWGLLMAGFWGFLWTLSRDLTELTEAVFVVAGLLAIRKRRPVVAGVLLSVAVLAREPALIVVGAVFVSRTWTRWHASQGDLASLPSRWHADLVTGPVVTANATWALPVAVFSAWQLAVLARTGSLPVFSSTGNNAAAPFSGLVDGIVHYVALFPHKAALEWGWECAVLAFFGALAAVSLRTSTALLHERIAWVFSLVFIVLLSSSVWLGDVGFRSLDDFYLLSGAWCFPHAFA